VAIVHYNTPELTEAAILSLRKHGGKDYRVVVFDNSDERGFLAGKPRGALSATPMGDVEVIDNTGGAVIDFKKELEKYTEKCDRIGIHGRNVYGSAKHMMSVQKLWELLPEGFLLMESDVLIRQSVDWMFMEGEAVCGMILPGGNVNPYGIDRLAPLLCWMNVPMLVSGGARYFDPERCWGLHSDKLDDEKNWWDTGAALLDDVKRLKPQLHGQVINDIRPYLLHYNNGSWLGGDLEKQKKWLNEHRDLWEPTPRERGEKRVAVCAIGRMENRYAVEWVEHYRKIGVSKLFVYDNWHTGDKERLADVLQPYIESGFVELTDWHDRFGATQPEVYEDCYRRHGGEYAWIGFLDFDEYLRFTDKRMKVEKYFGQFTDADCVLVNWRLMTDNGKVKYEDKPLAKRFTKAMPVETCVKYGFPENNHVKSFVAGGLGEVLFRTTPHTPSSPKLRCVNASGETVGQKEVFHFDHGQARIDHYWTKTAEEWKEKLARSFPNDPNYITFVMANEREWFFRVNERTKGKEGILDGKPVTQK